MTIATTKTVGEIAAEVPGSTREFEKLGIDYCCGGSQTLGEACAQAKIPVDEALDRLKQGAAAAAKTGSTEDWKSKPVADLIAHINATHHVSELLQVQEQFAALSEELSLHLMKEEQILFPYVIRMEESVLAGEPAPPAMFGTVMNPIGMMMQEHDGAGDALRSLRVITHDYKLPDDACASYRALYEALQGFEADLHQHIHKENNILFPRVAAMERAH